MAFSGSLPNHAYIPGVNDRHPEHAFDEIRKTAKQGLDANQLAHSDAYQAGLKFIDAGYYWEAHEVLEPVWMVLPHKTVERQFVQGLIQLANGRLKMHMGRPKAALRLVGQARGLIPRGVAVPIMLLDTREVHAWIDSLEEEIKLVL